MGTDLVPPSCRASSSSLFLVPCSPTAQSLQPLPRERASHAYHPGGHRELDASEAGLRWPRRQPRHLTFSPRRRVRDGSPGQGRGVPRRGAENRAQAVLHARQ